MNHDVSGPLRSSPLPMGANPTTSLPEDTIKALSASSVDTQVYEGTDTIGSAYLAFTPQFSVKEKVIYDANAQTPEIPLPDAEGERGPQPFGAAEQKLIMKRYGQRIKERSAQNGLSASDAEAIYHWSTKGTPLPNAKLQGVAQQIKQQATADVKEQEPRLPSSWSPDSQNAKDWTPVPLQLPDQKRQEEVNLAYNNALQEAYHQYVQENHVDPNSPEGLALWNAVQGGPINSQNGEAFIALSKVATEKTQKAMDLPSSWFKGTTNPADWTPINVGIITPTAVNEARGEMLLANIDLLLADFAKAGNQLTAGLNPDNSNIPTMDEFRRVISRAIRDLKEVLRDIQLKDSTQTKQAQLSKLDALEFKQKQLEQDIKKREETWEKQRKGEKVSLAMKIVGPIIAAIGTIVGAALAIFTFGASTALIVASVAIGAAMTAYAIVDSVTGITQKAIEAFNKLMEKAFPDNPLAQKLLKALIVTVIVAALIAAIVLSGGGAAGSVGSSLATQITKEIVKQLAIQLIVMTIMSSNAIPELLGEILRASGVSKEDSQIWEIVMMVITMITVMAAMAIGGKGGVSMKGIGEGIQSAGRTVKAIAEQSIQALKRLLEVLKEGITEAVQETIKLLKNLLKQLQAALRSLTESIKELPAIIKDSIKNSIQRVKEQINEILELIKDPVKLKQVAAQALETAMENLKEAVKQLGEALENMATTLKDSAVKGGKVAVEEIQAASEKVYEMTIAAATRLANKGVEAAKDILEGAKQIGKGFKNLPKAFKEAYELQKGIRSGQLTEMQAQALQSNVVKDARSALLSTQKVLQLTPEAIYIADGINRGILGLQVVKLLNEMGEIQESIALLEAIIKLLEKLQNSIQSGMDPRGEWIVSLQNAYNAFYDALSKATNKITGTIQG